MSAIKDGYITAAEAALLSGKGVNMIAKLCQSGRLHGAEKIGNAWIIPRASVLAYRPERRGPKTKKSKLAAERVALLKDARQGESETVEGSGIRGGDSS